MHSVSFVFDGNLFTIIFNKVTLRDGPVRRYGVLPDRGASKRQTERAIIDSSSVRMTRTATRQFSQGSKVFRRMA
jgi:hypothetical protein